MLIKKCERKRKIDEVFWGGNVIEIPTPKKKLKISN
jgi:hypothetical protein